MTQYFIIAALYTALCLAGYGFVEKHTPLPKKKAKGQPDLQLKNSHKYLALMLAAAFCLRLVLAMRNRAFWVDIGCFKAWADATTYYGLGGMYHSGMFLDYPPGYMYVLWLTRLLRGLLGFEYDSVAYTFLIKLPPMVADLASAYLIYRLAMEKLDSRWALFLSAAYVFGPGVVYTSSVWGQIDSFYTLFMVLALYYISKDDVVKASVVYAIALITKPQALLFGPVLLFWVISKKDWKILVKAVSIGLGCMWLLALPFGQSLSPLWLINLYKNTFNGYRYFTINGYNLYMLAGLNWQKLDKVAGAESINTVVILLCFVFCRIIYFRRKENKGKIFSTALVFITVFFSFCTMMHERYMHPAIILALVCYVLTEKKEYFYQMNFQKNIYLQILI